MKQQTLWTFDFTVITIGSVVSMVGSALVSFAISLLVLEYTGSTFLYMLFNVSFELPMLVCPVLAGPYLDRMSRKKVIYTLDFVSAGYYFLLFLLLHGGWFNYPVLLAGSFFTGVIGSVYGVAYESFYPNLVAEGHMGKAYSVGSILSELASMTYPLAAVLYSWLGSAAPLFAIQAVCCLIAACFERAIRCQETHMASAPPADGRGVLAQFGRDLREGMDYIRSEKGLLIIVLYFMCASVCFCTGDLILPYFVNHAERFAAWPVAAATLYAVIANCSTVGRFAGGLFQYKVRIPKERKFSIALGVYVVTFLLAGAELFLPVPLMAAAFFLDGVLGVTSYTIRAAATQSYVPDGKRARFNGAFRMLMSLGGIAGSLGVGALAELLPERTVVAGGSLLGLLVVYAFMYRGRKHVAAVYNRDV